ncbi:hypothetical protein BZA70DRAFT_293987 [Myxozyma melibiosi]|uniref:Altered inheritance of mitochondria protein 41 n=1 Tax=Myxozyma melibiosi TaxID=54550 RepID=A0ABR1FBR7_9ASCO
MSFNRQLLLRASRLRASTGTFCAVSASRTPWLNTAAGSFGARHERTYAVSGGPGINEEIFKSTFMKKISSSPEVMNCVADVMETIRKKGALAGDTKPSMSLFLSLLRDKEISESMAALKTALDKNKIHFTIDEIKGITEYLTKGKKR